MNLPLRQAALRLPGTFSAAILLGASGTAQQFIPLTGALPGPNRWTEGVAAADVDLDGDLDLFFANGDGFSSPGTKRQNTLVINRLVEQGPNVYADESVARLGTRASNAKLAVVGDVNGDGYPDVLFVNAFNTDVPFLYINRGAAQPGFFDMESATRGLTEVLSSAGGQFGDLDGDGDLDLILTDAGNSLLGGAGERPRMYLNDGAGFFTDVSSQLNAPIKVAQQDVQLIDVDNDWDLDVFIANRASNSGGTHYLLLNDGTGNFQDQSALLPTTSGSVYEAEAGDLDGDLDRDFFFLSLGGFQEGHVRNDLAETGSLGFTAGDLEPGNVDDNEVALFDYDVDGDFDVIIGSLGNRERVYRNNGGLDLVNTFGIIQNVADSTLDLAIADMDGDGDYDIVTGQGESGNFTNRLYLNSGPADTLAPLILSQAVLPPAGSVPARLVARIRDQVMDDGDTWVTMQAYFARVKPTIETVVVTAAGFSPATLSVLSGTRVRFVDGGIGASTLTEAGDLDWSLDLAAGGSVERVMVADVAQSVTASGATGSLAITIVSSPMEVEARGYGSALYQAFVPTLTPGQTAEIAYVLRAEDFVGNVSWSQSSTVRDSDAPGSNYCAPIANSTGEQARIVARGSDALLDRDLALEAWALPQSSFGFFLTSPVQGAMPVSQGVLCLGGSIGRFSNFVLNSGSAGSVSLPVPFAGLPSSVTFAPGSSWNFTYWFRDANPGIGANFSDGVEIVWR